ncbi:MAG: efflux RND transporter periplasmic adaptor subunit [Terracidiphilus sp.]
MSKSYISEETTSPQPSGVPTGRSTRRKFWPLILAAALITVVIIALVRKHKPASQAGENPLTTPNIRTATVHRGNIGEYIEALGTVTPLATVNLYSQVSGEVVAVHYVEGQIVRKGDPLIDIDPRPYEAQLQEDQGQLERDQAVLKQAEIDLARYKDAAAQDAVARQTYEDQMQTVEQDRGTVKNDLGQVEYGKVQLSYCHLVAPISGRVGLRLVDPGNVVFSGGTSPIVVIIQLQPMTVVFNVAEDDLDKVRSEVTHREALPVETYDRAQLKRIAVGKLLTLDNQVDTSTGTIRFRGQFDNADLALFPNQFVNARLLVQTLQGQLLVPAAAVQHNGVDAFVYVVRQGSVHLQSVDEIATEGDDDAVSGLHEGDVVAVTGFDKIQDGTRIAVLNTQTAANGASSERASGAVSQ